MTSIDMDRKAAFKAASPSKFAHIVLRSPNYEKMCAFYTELLQARSAFESPLVTFLRYDDEHHRIVIINMPGIPQKVFGAGLEHFSFTYESLGEMLATYERMKKAGAAPAWCVNHGMTLSIYYEDPDNNLVETQVDTLDVDEADAFMRSPYFAINPIGVDFDPDLMLERYLRGDSLAELARFGSAPYPAGVAPPRPPSVPDYDFRGDKLSTASAAPR